MPRMLVRTESNESHQKLIMKYKSALAVAEYLVRNP